VWYMLNRAVLRVRNPLRTARQGRVGLDSSRIANPLVQNFGNWKRIHSVLYSFGLLGSVASGLRGRVKTT